jgi:hypothetical protein
MTLGLRLVYLSLATTNLHSLPSGHTELRSIALGLMPLRTIRMCSANVNCYLHITRTWRGRIGWSKFLSVGKSVLCNLLHKDTNAGASTEARRLFRFHDI